MSRGELCLYSGEHLIHVFHRNGYIDERYLTINILDCDEKLKIKLRDPSDHSFNYTEYIDLGDFEVLRVKQSLDINYSEFKTNIVDMMSQFCKKEMFLKCELSEKKCTMVFYTKSKIKSIVYLTVDLRLTDQKEIISEMYFEINELKEVNNRLQKKLNKTQRVIEERNLEVQQLHLSSKTMVEKFRKEMKNIENFFMSKFVELQGNVIHKVSKHKSTLMELQRKVDVLKQENHLKTDSSDRLMKTMENLRLENMDYSKSIENLKRENTSLNILRVTLERNVADLKKSLDDTQNAKYNLEKKQFELERDLEKLTILITQKDNKISELSKDLVQANNMIVRFSNQCDKREQEVRELQEALSVKEKMRLEEKCHANQILKSFEEYKKEFNTDQLESSKQNITMLYKRIHDLEEDVRRLNKINAILTQKLSQDGFLISK